MREYEVVVLRDAHTRSGGQRVVGNGFARPELDPPSAIISG